MSNEAKCDVLYEYTRDGVQLFTPHQVYAHAKNDLGVVVDHKHEY